MRDPFIDTHVQAAPEQPGIFTLWEHEMPVYIGRTAPRSDLKTDLKRALAMTMLEELSATHFTFEVTPTPKTRATEELRDFFERWGALPRYNQPTRGRGGEGSFLHAR